ncbi:polynucleotide 5'-hydroxyl-kinase nol9-like isoform X2 [Halichondria panicea]|uniref:polynucleotide 5'-hydroxyl-kinase nol9-like isoform X2 n=1 Tax=Halichondria panicea TaxID=6063 RepID=UPI00312B5AA6
MDSRRASAQATPSNTVIAAASSTSQNTSSSKKKKKGMKNTSPGAQPTVMAKSAKVKKAKVSHTTVGLLMARSPWLRKDNIYLGVLQKHSVLHFHGCVQLQVLAGLIHCNGFIIKPTPTYHTLYSPPTSPSLALSPLDPQMQDDEFDAYLAPFRDRDSLHFHSSSKEPSHPKPKCNGSGCLHVDIGLEDANQLNLLIRKDWSDMTALVLLRAVEGCLVPLLNHWTHPLPILAVPSQVVQGFQTLTVTETKKKLALPQEYMEVAWEVAANDGAKVLVCGPGNSGKSTHCRFLINYMLNRYPRVCYLECDLGQPEFSVPEVLSLHIITAPLFGPPYTHFRKPYKSYYYGDKTPEADPEYYLSLLTALHQHFIEGVRSSDPSIPLVINTCGWVKNMGVQLFLDTVRVLTPTHIVRILLSPKINILEDLPLLTPAFLNSGSGLFRTPDIESAVTPGDNDDDDVIMYASSDEALSLSEESSDDLSSTSPSSDEDSNKSDQSESSNSDQLHSDNERRIRRKKLRMSGASYTVHGGRGQAQPRKHMISMAQHIAKGWIESPPYKVRYLNTLAEHSAKNSKETRRLGYIAYFSGLFPLANDIAKQHGLPDPHSNILRYAPPLEIPWKDVAVHVIHKNVLNSQSLYALNGKIVVLGRVDTKEFAERDPGSPDLPRFLKSDTPLIEFIGLGILRGVDIKRKVFYVTSPECNSTHSLARVNTIALGNPDNLDLYTSQKTEAEQPYMVKGYQSLLGTFSWKLS